MTEQATSGAVTMRFDLVRLRARLEAQTGQEIDWRDIADAVDLHRNTLGNLAHNKTRRVDLETLEKVMTFFRTRGLDVGPGDLFAVDEVTA